MTTEQLVKRPAEITIDGRGKEISTRIGQYSDAVTVQLAKKHNGQQVSVRDIVRCQYGRLNDRNEKYVRRKLSKAVNMLLKSSIPAILIYQETGRHQVLGIKVVIDYNAGDMASLDDYLTKAKHRGEISAEKVALIKVAMEKLREDAKNVE